MDETTSEILDNLKNNSNVSVFEEGVSEELLIEFVKFLTEANPNDFISNDINKDIEELFDKDTSIENQKIILVKLSFSENVKAYRAIEKFSKIEENELHSWSLMILQQSRMIIEGSLSKEDRIYVVSEMGGKGNKIRHMGVFSLKNQEEKFSKYQTDLVQNELKYTLERNGNEIEDIKLYDTYITFIFLTPFDSKIIDILENVIFDCNEFGDFLNEDVFITTTKLENENDIKELIENSKEETKIEN